MCWTSWMRSRQITMISACVIHASTFVSSAPFVASVLITRFLAYVIVTICAAVQSRKSIF